MKNTALVYVHDPMCSWCWGFRPVLNRLMASLPQDLEVLRILGGLAPDSSSPMSPGMKQYLQQAWRSVAQKIPGTEFNFDFWENCIPRRSTYPACRGVIAATLQGGEFDEQMTLAIQTAYYTDSKNPSDDTTLISLADDIGLNKLTFTNDLNSPSTNQALSEQIDFSRQLGVQGFPGLLLIFDNSAKQIPISYTDHLPILNKIESAIETHFTSSL